MERQCAKAYCGTPRQSQSGLLTTGRDDRQKIKQPAYTGNARDCLISARLKLDSRFDTPG